MRAKNVVGARFIAPAVMGTLLTGDAGAIKRAPTKFTPEAPLDGSFSYMSNYPRGMDIQELVCKEISHILIGRYVP